jgi:hypothetical protein
VSTSTQPVPYRRLRVAAGIVLALTFVLALVSIYGGGVLSRVGVWPFLAALAASVAVTAVTISAYRRR